LVTKLTGRYIEFNIFPLTFEEYLSVKEFLGKQISADNMTELRSYLLEGGFPYTLRLNSMNDKRRYVQNLIDEIYEKDIRQRVKIRNRAAFDTVMKYIINNFGATTNLLNITEDFAKSGTVIKRTTVDRYINAQNREYRSLESVKGDNYPKYLLTTDTLLQKRNGIAHENLMQFIKESKSF